MPPRFIIDRMKEKLTDLTPRALALALGVNVSTIARWKKQGCPYKEKAPYAIGAQSSRPRYDILEVKAWISKQKQKHEEDRHRA